MKECGVLLALEKCRQKEADKSDRSQRSFFRILGKLFDFRNPKVSNVKKSARLSPKKSVLLTVGRQIFKKSRDKH